jgi:outer membrane protein assembly factor BamB
VEQPARGQEGVAGEDCCILVSVMVSLPCLRQSSAMLAGGRQFRKNRPQLANHVPHPIDQGNNHDRSGLHLPDELRSVLSLRFTFSQPIKMTMTESPDIHSSQQTVPSGNPLRHRWFWGLGILIVGVIAEIGVWAAFAPDRTYQVFFSLPVVSGTVFFSLLWWAFLSPVQWSVRGIGLLVVAACAGGFWSLYTFDGFEGDMIPRFRRRSEVAEQERRREQFIAESASTNSSRPASNVRPSESDTDGTPHEDAVTAPEFAVSPTDWAEYRGPRRDGVLNNLPAGIDWTKTPSEVWRHPIGAGWSSFAVAGGFAITQEQRSDQECVVCYEAATGKQIWVHTDAYRFDEAMGGPGPRATPTIHGSRAYSLGAGGQLNCLDVLTGEGLWGTNILNDTSAKNLEWAMAGSPLVVDGKVIVNPGGADGQGLVAYNTDDGKVVWSSGNDQASYTAPMLAELGGTQQVLLFDGKGIAGHSLEDGKELWKFSWENDPKVNASIPIPINDRSVFIGAGYGVGSALLKVTPDGNAWATELLWKSPKFKLKFNAAIRHENSLYGLSEGILSCINLETGEHQWKKGRYGYGQLLLAGNVLVVQAESGDVAFVRASPEEYEELHRFKAIEGKTWNHPVIWQDMLLVRNAEEAACFKLRD